MRTFLIYWIIGCLVVGFPLGMLLTDCPKAKIETAEVIRMIAVWPVVFAMVIARTGKLPLPKTECEAP